MQTAQQILVGVIVLAIVAVLVASKQTTTLVQNVGQFLVAMVGKVNQS